MAQPYYIPPDPWDDGDNANYSVWPNAGQVVNDQGNAVPDISYYTEGGVQTYFLQDGLFSMVYGSPDSTAGLDSLRRFDVAFAGTKANHPDPVASALRSHHATTAETATTSVATTKPRTNTVRPRQVIV